MRRSIPRYPTGNYHPNKENVESRHRNARTLKWSAWLGWQMESNWADPFLFMVYSVAKPIAASLILVVMYSIIAAIGGGPDIGLFHYMFVSNAFFMYVGQVLFGVAQIVHDDREHFQTMKYIYISPSNYFSYMIGRSVSKMVITTFAVIITMAFGVFLLNVPLNIFTINWLLFMAVMVIGIFCIMAFGLALAGLSFLTAKHQGGMNEGIAGLFYLFCGVVFPVSILPSWGMSFAKILPITYWLELVRRTLNLGVGMDSTLSGASTAYCMAILCLSTLIFSIVALAIFKVGDTVARQKGLIDMTTAY
ncbi:MAG: ABC transporter permease [Candidatus Thermoplasmatota archaeon]|nr:ABC transporter permease [Candidatus Thermoplasmatota archaeon]MBU4071783.1 ABC transporter permease [Candidatus Thermoplasmatota archaeon]MBU4592485.1 ABC transporter permease [Candidatus Thermoplasmatota archaeon]